jgi:hypothetical protein
MKKKECDGEEEEGGTCEGVYAEGRQARWRL